MARVNKRHVSFTRTDAAFSSPTTCDTRHLAPRAHVPLHYVAQVTAYTARTGSSVLSPLQSCQVHAMLRIYLSTLSPLLPALLLCHPTVPTPFDSSCTSTRSPISYLPNRGARLSRLIFASPELLLSVRSLSAFVRAPTRSCKIQHCTCQDCAVERTMRGGSKLFGGFRYVLSRVHSLFYAPAQTLSIRVYCTWQMVLLVRPALLSTRSSAIFPTRSHL